MHRLIFTLSFIFNHGRPRVPQIVAARRPPKTPLVIFLALIASTCGSLPSACADEDLAAALKAVASVGPAGVNQASAARAMRTLNAATATDVPKILEAMDDSNVISQNWLRSAIVSIADREEDLPRDEITAYFSDTNHSPMGRLVAFELLSEGNEAWANEMIPELINDPSMPLRRKAVDRLIRDAAELVESDQVTAIGKLGFALNKARDVAQVQTIANQLGSLGVNVNLQKQLGFLNRWQIVGTFDNKDMAGFDVVHGPEQSLDQLDLTSSYQAMTGEATWQKVTTDDPTGNVDLNSLIGKLKGGIAYAYTTFNSDSAQVVDLRIGTANATKVWVNGELVMSNEIYHNSNSIDKFIGQAQLKKGENQILIKVCQNEQTESWAQDWQFQFRVCDATGKPILDATAAKTE